MYVVELLFDRDADVNVWDVDHSNSLRRAVQNRSLDTVQFLLSHGADELLLQGGADVKHL
jgi:ankyrin repeat protein